MKLKSHHIRKICLAASLTLALSLTGLLSVFAAEGALPGSTAPAAAESSAGPAPTEPGTTVPTPTAPQISGTSTSPLPPQTASPSGPAATAPTGAPGITVPSPTTTPGTSAGGSALPTLTTAEPVVTTPATRAPSSDGVILTAPGITRPPISFSRDEAVAPVTTSVGVTHRPDAAPDDPSDPDDRPTVSGSEGVGSAEESEGEGQGGKIALLTAVCSLVALVSGGLLIALKFLR